MKVIHITYHEGTKKNIENVCNYFQYSLETEIPKYPLYISNKFANELWKENSERWKKYDVAIFSDTSMLARPFLENINKHSLKIIIYITNRFHWGDFELKDKAFLHLYSTLSNHKRVFFCADNRFDQYWASSFNIHFYFNDIIRLYPIIKQPSKYINPRFFVYNRGPPTQIYTKNLNKLNIDYDMYGGINFPKFKDQSHIAEYKAIIHLPYQTNIQSLYENLGYGIVYIIPSQKCITEWILNEDWYYWEEKTNMKGKIIESIELSEWYQKENEDMFVYFDNWEDLKRKTLETDFEKKQNIIHEKIYKYNNITIHKWKEIFLNNTNETLIAKNIEYKNINNLPTFVTCFYDIRKLENIDKKHNRQIDKYLELASQFYLKLPYPIIFFTDDDEIMLFVKKKREENGLLHLTDLYHEPFENTYFYHTKNKIEELQKEFFIMNGDRNHETPLYIILNNNKFHFIEKSIEKNPFQSTHFIWMDFGINHVAKNTEKIHEWVHHVPDKIKQLCINPYLENEDRKIFFKYIYHHTAGGLFSGNIHYLKIYIQKFKDMIEKIYSENWYQIDEAIMTMVQRDNIDIFDLYYGDYEGIISNYMKPIHNLSLISIMLEKAKKMDRNDYLFKICYFLIPYFQNIENQKKEFFVDFIQKNIICNYYQNHKKLLPEIIDLININIKNNNQNLITLIKHNQYNLSFYLNKDSIQL